MKKLMTMDEIGNRLLEQSDKVTLMVIGDKLEAFDDCGGVIESYQQCCDGLYYF